MKKFILLLVWCLMLIANLQAQTVFAPPNSIWHCEDVPEDSYYGDSYVKYETVKDTVFEGKLCSKIVGKKVQLNRIAGRIDTTKQKDEYTFTSGDTVFYYNDVFHDFLPLYIFNVAKGDTVVYHIPYTVSGYSYNFFKVKIDSIKTVNIDGLDLRKVWTSGIIDFDIFGMGTYIERIGSIRARELVGHIYDAGLPHGGRLRCYEDGVISENFIVDKSPCEYINTTSIAEIDMSEKFLVYPNPASDYLIIENTGVLNKRFDVEIYSLTGQLVYSGANILWNNFNIDIKNLYPSTYCLLIYDESRALVQKKILIKN